MALIANDDSAQTEAGTPVTVNVLANDTLDGAPVTLAELVAPPEILAVRPSGAGAAAANADGTVTFTPAPGFTGDAEVDYSIETTGPGPEPGICAGVELHGPVEGSQVYVDPAPPWWGEVGNGAVVYVYGGNPDGSEWWVDFYKNDGVGTLIESSGTMPSNQVVEATIESHEGLTHCAHFILLAA